jgi:hypothetical protein
MKRELSQQEIQQINEDLFAGRKIAAIKTYREATECDLKDAKDFIDQLETQLRTQYPDKFTKLPISKGCLILFLLVDAVIVIGIVIFFLR